MNVMFVCTGNTCRSPMAVSLFTKRLNKEGRSDIQCRSAGLAACEGQGASWRSWVLTLPIMLPIVFVAVTS